MNRKTRLSSTVSVARWWDSAARRGVVRCGPTCVPPRTAETGVGGPGWLTNRRRTPRTVPDGRRTRRWCSARARPPDPRAAAGLDVRSLTWAEVWGRRLARHALLTPAPAARLVDVVGAVCGI